MTSPPSNTGSTNLGRFQMPQVGDTLEGRYEITKMLATGGMGVILQAKHVRMGRDVAIKILHPHIAQEARVVARFEREVRLAQMLNHPNTIRLYDVGEADNGLIYVVMELLEGADLKEVIAREGPLPVGRAVDLTLQVLDGLGEAHEQDFVHRDLKPSNIFVVTDRRGADQVKILDFGIAKSLEEGDGDLTATGSICGTAAYVAPEYLHDATPRKTADVYAVGLILLEMLTGQRAFQGTTTAQTLMMQLQREIQVPRPLASTPLAEILRRSASRDPASRYQTADEMFKALDAVADQLPAEMRLRPGQIGSILRPPSVTFPGTVQVGSGGVRAGQVGAGRMETGRVGAGRVSPTSPSAPQESSTSLPQAGDTPLSGEHSAPQIEMLEGDATIVTPFPSPMGSSQEFPFRASDDSTALQPESEAMRSRESGESKKKRVVAVIAGGAVAAIVFAGIALMEDAAGDGTEPAVEIESSDKPPKSQPAESQPAESQSVGAALAESGQAESGPAELADNGAESAAADSAAVGALDAAEGAVPENIEFRVESVPESATVFDGDEEIGQTPLSHTFESDVLPRVLRIEKEGFEAAEIEVSDESDTTRKVMLIEKPKPRVEKPKPASQRRPSRTSRPKKSSGEASKPKEGEEKVDEFLDEYL